MFGFVLTRHVTDETTNKYWNQSVKLIQLYYPSHPIVIIDDASNQIFVKSFDEYNNLTIIQSEFPHRGELLPYLYYIKYQWFPRAIFLHDSTFLHMTIPFDTIRLPV